MSVFPTLLCTFPNPLPRRPLQHRRETGPLPLGSHIAHGRMGVSTVRWCLQGSAPLTPDANYSGACSEKETLHSEKQFGLANKEWLKFLSYLQGEQTFCIKSSQHDT